MSAKNISPELERMAAFFDALARKSEGQEAVDRAKNNDHCASYESGKAHAYRLCAAEARGEMVEFVNGIISKREKQKGAQS